MVIPYFYYSEVPLSIILVESTAMVAFCKFSYNIIMCESLSQGIGNQESELRRNEKLIGVTWIN